jgi:hypothetical protein
MALARIRNRMVFWRIKRCPNGLFDSDHFMGISAFQVHHEEPKKSELKKER